MSNLTLQEHMQKCAERSKTYTNEKLVEFNTAVVEAMKEIVTALTATRDEVKPLIEFYNASGLCMDGTNIAQKEEDTNG